DTFFDTLTVRCDADHVVERALEVGINLRRIDSEHVGVSLDETSTDELVDRLLGVFEGNPEAAAVEGIPNAARRRSPFLQHPVFNTHRSEHAMLRYLRRLADRDLALDRTMIPLGSCTMKLNATTEMIPLTWPEFTDLHPFVPAEQAAGYRELIGPLGGHPAEACGDAAGALQPDAGSQGELAGLLAIRAYHRSRGEEDRVVCLIPQSAHGTNAASAAMAGMEVVVVATDDRGNVDLVDLEKKASANAERLAAIMVT